MRLKTFGGLWIEGVSPPATLGPRPLALLALVAAAGRRGMSRDQLVGLLWTEAGEDQARHALSQTLYRLKRETGQDWLGAGPTLRLDPAAASDIGDFQEALTRGDHTAAAALYTGPFLDGFYLSGAPEFERWVEGERARLHAAVLGAMEQAVAAAEARGDSDAALRFWSRLTDLDPLSARYAAGRMRALAQAGDRASALAHARQHETTVRRELDAAVDPVITELARGLKSNRPLRPPSPGAPASPTGEHRKPGPGSMEPQLIPPGSRARTVRLAGLALAAALILLIATVLRPGDRPVTPFLAVGTIATPEQTDSGALGLVLRDMLATTLGGLEGVQVVANSRLVELTAPELADDARATADAARRAGATELIEGELALEAGALVLVLRRVDLDRGLVRRGYLVRADNRYALVDSAVATVARDLGLSPPTLTVRDVRTASPEAYLLYSEGLRAYYSFDGAAASRLMKAALERDSTFAMAAYYAWVIGDQLADPATKQREAAVARRLATRTIERERLLIMAELARVEAPITVAAAIAETLTVRYPSDPDGFIILGQTRFAQGAYAEAVTAFGQAFAIDSAAATPNGPFCRSCLALGHMAVAYTWWDSAGAAERVGHRLVALRPGDPGQWSTLIEPLLRQGRRAEAEAALERGGMRRDQIEYFATMLNRDRIRWGQYEELDQRLLSDLESPARAARGDARWLLMLSLRDQGRLREAWALGREGRIPGTTRTMTGEAPEPILSAALWQDMGRPDSAARLLHESARLVLASTVHTPANTARHATWYLTLAGTAYEAAGDTAMVRLLADSTEELGKGSSFGRDLILHHYLRGLLRQREGRHAEAVDAFRRSLFSLTDGYTRINLAMARSLLALRRPAEAIAVLRPAIHGGVDGSNTYTSRTELHEAMAQAFELAGQRDSAVAHYRAVERAWRRADPEFGGRRARARTAGETLSRPAT